MEVDLSDRSRSPRDQTPPQNDNDFEMFDPETGTMVTSTNNVTMYDPNIHVGNRTQNNVYNDDSTHQTLNVFDDQRAVDARTVSVDQRSVTVDQRTVGCTAEQTQGMMQSMNDNWSQTLVEDRNMAEQMVANAEASLMTQARSQVAEREAVMVSEFREVLLSRNSSKLIGSKQRQC